MQRIIYRSIIVMGLATNLSLGQSKPYTASSVELILSLADVSKPFGATQYTVTTGRFTAFNLQYQVHIDVDENLGFFSGLNLRNVGYAYFDPFTSLATVTHTVRNYTLGIPFAMKVGNMNGYSVFWGYELELPFNYKEKDDGNVLVSEWFSNRTPSLYHSIFLGLQFPNGRQLKLKYYFSNFYNIDYAMDNGSGGITYPYKSFSANVYYVSLTFVIFKGKYSLFSDKYKKTRGIRVTSTGTRNAIPKENQQTGSQLLTRKPDY